MFISFNKGNNQSLPALCEKVKAPSLIHELTVINHIICEAEFNFTSPTPRPYCCQTR